EAALRRALAALGDEFQRPHWRIEVLQAQLAGVLLEQGRRDEARAALGDAPAALAKVLVPDDRRLAAARAVAARLAAP
ncbi:MAG TPA: hypothetical protein VFL14_12945, partial [Xanthomonadales bacterium]|nr:hypothetical protein [Xanthomonadales bacterium]